ncbi:MAG: SRPBCC family protein [Caulobacter sp.]|nr:SRPBCC family protein [Caulobacter sp.]
MTERSVVHATFAIDRIYEAKPARVFKAFSDPDIRDRWFVRPHNWPVAEYSYDFRVGGQEKGRFSPNGTMIVLNETTYWDIVPDARIIFAYAMYIDGKRISVSVATVEFKPAPNGTRLIYTEQGAFLDGYDIPAQREEGCRDLYERLAEELARMPADA